MAKKNVSTIKQKNIYGNAALKVSAQN